MHRHLGTVGLALLASASPAWAQSDTIRYRDSRTADLNCDIVSMTWKEIKVNIVAGDTFVTQSMAAKDVKEIVFNPERRGFEFGAAEQNMSQNQFEEAIVRFQKALKDRNCPEPVRQLARLNIARCHYRDGQPDKAIVALQDLRKEVPDTFYFAESYVLQYESYRSKTPADLARMEQTLQEFGREAESKGVKEWKGSAEVLQGELCEFQKKWDQALTIHAKYAGDPVVGDDAKLGEMRCYAAKANWSALKSRADAILADAKGKKNYNERLLIGAYNARGDVLLSQQGKTKDALLDFLRGVMVLNPSGDPSREHEAAIAKAALACSRYASELKEPADKGTYKDRAEELLRDLERLYSGSDWKKAVEEAIQAIR